MVNAVNKSKSRTLQRTSLIVIIAALMFSACGAGSISNSSTSHRTKNAALTPPITGCVASNNCKPGDIGPAGGVILSVTDDSGCGKSCLYTEVAPDKWADSLKINCDGSTPRTTVAGVASIDPKCNLDQDNALAKAYTGGSTCNWVIPTFEQMKLFKSVNVPGLQDFYWTTAKVYFNNDRGSDFSYGIKMADLSQTNPRTRAEAYVRPVRAYSTTYLKTLTACGNAAAPPVGTTTTSTTTTVKPTTTTSTTTTTTTTVKPTTTTAAVVKSTCASPTSCKVGDIGPGLGIVFYVSSTPFTLASGDATTCKSSCHFLEAAPNTWYGTGFDPIYTASATNGFGPAAGSFSKAIGSGLANTLAVMVKNKNDANLAAGVARTYRGGGKGDWFLPSVNELNEMYKSRALVKLNTKITKDVEYWSSTGKDDKAQYPTQFYMKNLDTGASYEAQGGLTPRYVRAIRAG